MIVHSVFTVSCPSCGAPFMLTKTLVSRSDQPHADSLELCTFSSLVPGKMAVFDATEPLYLVIHSLKDIRNRHEPLGPQVKV